MKILLLILVFYASSLFSDNNNTVHVDKNIWQNKNIWIKAYSNKRNYNIIINNIVKLQQKIKKSKNNPLYLEELNSRLTTQQSKLRLYERNKSFDSLLIAFKFEINDITMRDYLFKESLKELNKMIDKYLLLKNQFYIAVSILKNYSKKSKDKYNPVSQSDIEYFEEFSESVDKTYLNLIEARDELGIRYEQYSNDKLQKHIMTIVMIAVAYLVYKIIAFFILFLESKLHKNDSFANYKKFLSILFFTLVFVFLAVRYLENFMYIITFLGVIAAALTIALREIFLNLVGSVYIFFSNMVRVGDRIMIQFETKHTIGDIADISLMKIKLHEIEDYTNVKEVKNVGRTIYIPNSYVFTKVFYNYSRKKDGVINDLIEFEFTSASDFNEIENTTKNILDELRINHKLTFTLNGLKTGVVGLISYEVNYKDASKIRGDISIKLLQAYNENKGIHVKSSTKSSSKTKPEEE